MDHTEIVGKFILVLSSQNTHTASLLDLLLGQLGKKLRFHDHWLRRQHTFAQNLEVVVLGDIDHGNCISRLSRCVLFANFLSSQSPECVQVHDWAVILVALEMEVSHTDFTKVPRVVLIEVNSVMVLTTSITTTSWMLAVLANTPLAARHISSKLSAFTEPGGHDLK